MVEAARHARFILVGEDVAFIEHTLKDQCSVFDLQPFRTERAARKEGGTGFEQLVFAYDHVVMVPKGHAAEAYGD